MLCCWLQECAAPSPSAAAASSAASAAAAAAAAGEGSSGVSAAKEELAKRTTCLLFVLSPVAEESLRTPGRGDGWGCSIMMV